jgi:hypothetical protein
MVTRNPAAADHLGAAAALKSKAPWGAFVIRPNAGMRHLGSKTKSGLGKEEPSLPDQRREISAA